MRRFLVLALTLALGLTALAAAPAAAGSEDDDEACRVVRTSEGPECLTDEEIRQLRAQRRDDRDKRQTRDHDGRDRDDRSDRHRKRDDRDGTDSKRDDRYDRKRDDRDGTDRWWRWWFRYWDDRSDDCDCLNRREQRWLERLADDPTRSDTRKILRYLYRQDCLDLRDFRSLRRQARHLDESQLLDIIRDADRCDDCDGGSHYWLYDRDYRRLDRMTGLDERSIRRLLRVRNGHDCVDRGDIRRLGRRIGGNNDWDFFDLYDWGG